MTDGVDFIPQSGIYGFGNGLSNSCERGSGQKTVISPLIFQKLKLLYNKRNSESPADEKLNDKEHIPQKNRVIVSSFSLVT
jgi:hypothetical protein